MSRDRFYISELMRAVQRCETAGIDVGRGKRDYKDGYNCRVFIMDETGRRT